jgi:ribulose-5-phosphate 4-epimerase/fuculose-1-phosphate aldolase
MTTQIEPTTAPATTAYHPEYTRPPLPELTAHAELAVFLRVLSGLGYDDGRAGHTTVRQPDGNLLISPRELAWCEVRASDVVTITAEGVKVAGTYNPSPAYGIHLELRKRRPDLGVVVHHHPRWATVWADVGRIPPVYDQTSASVPYPLALVDEYGGTFTDDLDESARCAELFGDAEWGLLANHGVLLTGASLAEAYIRAYTVEYRSRRAWHVETLGGGRPLSDEVAVSYGRRFEPVHQSWWESAMRIEIARDPSVLA